MAISVYYTEFEEESGIYRVEIFQGVLETFSYTKVQFDNAALDFDDKWEEGLQNNGLGLRTPSSLKCKVDIAKLPTALKKIITTPQSSYVTGQYNPSTCWVLKRNDKYPGKIVTGSINTSGTGYSNATNLSPSGGSGAGAKFDITTSGGAVTVVTIIDGGRDYVVNELLTIPGGGGNATFIVDSVVDIDVWHVDFVGTQYQGLDKDWKPLEIDRRLDVEVFDIHTDILSQTTFKDLMTEILTQTAAGWDADVVMRKAAIDYVIMGANDSIAANDNAFSIRFYRGPLWMRFYPVSKVFDAIRLLLHGCALTYYGLDYIVGLNPLSSTIYRVASPLNHWRFFEQAYDQDDFDFGAPVDPTDVYTCLFVTETDAAHPTYDDIADGLIANGKSSLEERYKGKGIIEWLNKEWEAHLAKERMFPNAALSDDWQKEDIDASPIWFPQKFGEHHSAATVATPEIELSDISDATVKKAEEFITTAKVVINGSDEHFQGEYSTPAASSRKEQNRDFEMTFHNMPSMKQGLKYRAGSTWGAMNELGAVPFGVLFYIGDTGMTTFGYADLDTDIPIRVSERSYCVLDADAAIVTSEGSGTTKDLFSTTGFDLTDGTQSNNWDVTAKRAQAFCMPQHVALTMMKLYNNPDRLNFEMTLPLSEYRNLLIGQRATLDIRGLIDDADIFENVGSDYIYITSLEHNIVQNTLLVKAISEGYNG